ncbi:MAG: flagellar hook-basal body complex protein, partial [Clostridiales bacterium]|nr:flagellar hook-basal body complex protein [Clostridiales bacterium]
MFEAMLSAASGLMGQQRRIDTIADNLANVNTAAHKASRLNFKDMIYVDGRYPYRDAPLNQQKGHGVLTASISRNFATGSLSGTERELDFALEGEGFFMTLSPDGNINYTRQGNFYLSTMEGQMYLVNSQGHFVLDDEGVPIILPDDASSLTLNSEGEITFSGPDGFVEDGGAGIQAADLVAADMIAQAEHDPDACSRALVPSMEIAEQIVTALERQLRTLSTAETASASLESGGVIIIYKDREEAVRIANTIAPEHLELQTADTESWI